MPQGRYRSTGVIAGRCWLFMICFLVLAFSSVGRAQSPTSELSGMWTATVGNGPAMRGMWLAEMSKASPNFGRGSWSLLSDAGEVVLQGTWSARKIGSNWQGSWTARTASGRSLSGTWSAALGDFKGLTLREMLALTMEKQIGGAWQSGRYQGNWWLEGNGNTKKRR